MIRRLAGMNRTRAFGIVIGLSVVLVGVLMYQVICGDESEPGGLVFVIPAGASEQVDVPTIDSAIEIPTNIILTAGKDDSVTIVNNDSVANRAGPWVIGPGQSYTIRFDKPGEYTFVCNVDPSETVIITVNEPQ